MFSRRSFVHVGSAYRADTVLIPRIPWDTPLDPRGTSSPWPDLIWQAPEGLPLGPFIAGCTSLWSLRGLVVDPCTAAWHDTPISNHGPKHTSCSNGQYRKCCNWWHRSDCCYLWINPIRMKLWNTTDSGCILHVRTLIPCIILTDLGLYRRTKNKLPFDWLSYLDDRKTKRNNFAH